MDKLDVTVDFVPSLQFMGGICRTLCRIAMDWWNPCTLSTALNITVRVVLYNIIYKNYKHVLNSPIHRIWCAVRLNLVSSALSVEQGIIHQKRDYLEHYGITYVE